MGQQGCRKCPAPVTAPGYSATWAYFNSIIFRATLPLAESRR